VKDEQIRRIRTINIIITFFYRCIYCVGITVNFYSKKLRALSNQIEVNGLCLKLINIFGRRFHFFSEESFSFKSVTLRVQLFEPK